MIRAGNPFLHPPGILRQWSNGSLLTSKVPVAIPRVSSVHARRPWQEVPVEVWGAGKPPMCLLACACFTVILLVIPAASSHPRFSVRSPGSMLLRVQCCQQHDSQNPLRTDFMSSKHSCTASKNTFRSSNNQIATLSSPRLWSCIHTGNIFSLSLMWCYSCFGLINGELSHTEAFLTFFFVIAWFSPTMLWSKRTKGHCYWKLQTLLSCVYTLNTAYT